MPMFRVRRTETHFVEIEASNADGAENVARRMDHDDADWEFDDSQIEVVGEAD